MVRQAIAIMGRCHRKKTLSALKNDLAPWLGSKPIDVITSLDLLNNLQRIENRGAKETSRNARQMLSQIFRYARVTPRTTNNPADDLRGAMAPKIVKNRPAITDPKEFGRLLVNIDNYTGGNVVRALLAICPLVFQRPGEMITMEWKHLDFEAAEWRYTPTKSIKKKTCPDGIPHLVPLSKQVLSILNDLHPLTGHGRYVFPSELRQGGHVSNMTFNKALKLMGYNTSETHCAHGIEG